ncbi:MAG: cation:proton antiporter [Nitrososphaerota archaeon]|nr:cation:proton antiporter [Nitrososphaerota archaeon]MDG6977794.1 cation:proton antiporter [Nitrososphaerota archaeon]MDG7005776.1 cation:proton antiporter [Nitrososphaerota archaeon]MDG7020863.1 cation:proton antiporter [Nitrososphaerota archaeon]
MKPTADITLVFAIVAAVIVLGFGGELFFKRTGIPSFLFLIFVGILLGPVFNIVSGQQLVPVLGVIATLTLIMVIFYSGMDLRIRTVFAESGRVLVQVLLYVLPSTLAIGLITSLVFHWDLIQALILGSIIGGETTAAVVVPLSRGLHLNDNTVTFISLEAVLNSVFSVVLFTTFVAAYQSANPSVMGALSTIASDFSVGIVLGGVLSIAWILVLQRLKDNQYTYVFTMGLVFATYAISTSLGGSGILSTLVFGMVLGSYKLLNSVFEKMRLDMDPLQKQLGAFQKEMSFLLETFFFVFLGLIFSIDPANILAYLGDGVFLLVILLAFRSLATTVSTRHSPLAGGRRLIVMMCAQGLTPATLAIIAVNDHIPLAPIFLNIVTYVIILTNVVTTFGSFWVARHGRLVPVAKEPELVPRLNSLSKEKK